MDGGSRLPKKPKFWLGIGGSFNPIHVGHIKVLELAKQHLEEEFGQGCVLGGFLAVATQGWVVGKLGSQDAIKQHHRIAMANLAITEVAGRAWLQPTQKAYGSSISCIKGEVPTTKIDDSTLICDCSGGDRAKGHVSRGLFYVNIGRPGTTEVLANSLKVPPCDGKWYKVAVNVRFLNVEIGDHSSTNVRRALKQGTLKSLVDDGIIDPIIGDYLIEHQNDLFEK